jgi:hypothetical protein
MLLMRVYPGRRRIFRSLAFVGAMPVAVAIASAITLWPRLNAAVILAREAPAFTSPVTVAEPAFELREGETVTVRAEHQGFALVQTLAGRAGWVARANLSLVVPRSGNGSPSHKRT